MKIQVQNLANFVGTLKHLAMGLSDAVTPHSHFAGLIVKPAVCNRWRTLSTNEARMWQLRSKLDYESTLNLGWLRDPVASTCEARRALCLYVVRPSVVPGFGSLCL